LALSACFGIALTHDYLSTGRARVQAASAVIAAGIPRTQVSAGLEYDAWTELEQYGYIRHPSQVPPRRYPTTPPFWFWPKLAGVDPIYIVTYSPLPGLVDSQFPPVPFTAWLPPFHRRLLIQKPNLYDGL
jgi:hypothetical protein